MPEYTIVDNKDTPLGHVNMTSCECKHLAHIGMHLNGHKFVYNPLKHSIKECYHGNCLPDFSTCSTKVGAPPCCAGPGRCTGNQWSTSCHPKPTPMPSCTGIINEKQCTAWKNFFDALSEQNKNSLEKKCGNIYEHPCLCPDLITCSAEYITELKFNGNGMDELSFNLSSIVDFSNLELIAMSSNYINGSLSDLSSMHKLTTLNCPNATLNGNLNNLSKMSGLQYIDLQSSPDITGDISSLISLKQLQYIDLQISTGITGDISSLSNLNNLAAISLGGKITGDISSWFPLKNLRYIAFNNVSPITGDLSSLRNMTKLYAIDFENAVGIRGNLDSLSEMKYLEEITLDNSTEISGNLSYLSTMYNLNILSLYKAKYITGNLNSLQKLNLEVLYIPDSKLDGSCSDISNLLQNLVYDPVSETISCMLKVVDPLCISDFSKHCKFLD